MPSPAPMSRTLPTLQTLGDNLQAWNETLETGLMRLDLPGWLAAPTATLLLVLGAALLALLLWRLTNLLPALALLLQRGLELVSRLWRLLRATLVEVFWVDPARRSARHARHARRRRSSDDEPSLGTELLRILVDLIWLPFDWLASLGLQRLLRPDPASEEKQDRRRLEPAGLSRRLGWAWKRHGDLPLVLSVLRLLIPRLWVPRLVSRQFVKPDSYGPRFPIRRVLWLTLNADVREVLERPDEFEVVYGPRMQMITQPMDDSCGNDDPVNPDEHGNFLLGMQNTPRYTRDVSNMRLAFRREDAERCRVLAERAADAALRRAIGTTADARGPRRLNLPVDLVFPVAEALINEYFGIPVPLRCQRPDTSDDERIAASDMAPGKPLIDENHRWLEALFDHIFYDIKGEKSLHDCKQSAPLVRGALRQIIRQRRLEMERGEAVDADDVLSRCLRLQRSGTPGMDDETLRVNLTGFLVGAMTPLVNATCQVVDVLLERRIARWRRFDMACGSDRGSTGPFSPAQLQACIMEALRFWPGDPVIWRWSNTDCVIGADSRPCNIPRDTLVMAWNSSAMFDPALVKRPWQFRTDRPSSAYVHWGYGQHSCAGAYLNMAVIPGMLGPLLRQWRLERAPGIAGQPRSDGPDGITIRRFELMLRP